MPEVEFARDTRKFVEMFLQMGVSHQWFYRMMIGRLYYAAHHLGRRLLMQQGLQPEGWRTNVHQRVIEELYRHFVSSGRMRLDSWEGLDALRDMRGRTDYNLIWRCRLRDVNRAVTLFDRFCDECCGILEVE